MTQSDFAIQTPQVVLPTEGRPTGCIRGFVYDCGSDLARGAISNTPELVTAFTNAVQEQAKSLLSSEDYNIGHSFVEFGSQMLIVLTSKEWTTRLLATISILSKVLNVFSLGDKLYQLGKYLIKVFVQYCRDSLGSIPTDIYTYFLDLMKSWGLVKPGAIVPQASMKKGMTYAIVTGLLLHLIKMGISYIQSLFKSWWVSQHWLSVRAELAITHRELFLALEGNRMIREAGSQVWLHSHSNNALFAYRVAHWANLAATRYETSVCPIDKGMFRDMLFTARANAVLATSLVSGNRPGSVILYMLGSTRQGKTVASQLIGNRLNKILGAPSGAYFTFPIESEFKDGYCCQPVVLISDVFKLNAKIDRVPEAKFIMQSHDTDPYVLNMAKAEEKGTVFFDSPYVICTSNVDISTINAGDVGLSDRDAMLSRLDIFCRVECIDYGVMDKVDGPSGPIWLINDDKIDAQYPNGPTPDIYKFTIINALSKKIIKSCGFDELIEMLEKRRHRRLRKYLNIAEEPPWDEIDSLIQEYSDGHSLPPLIEFKKRSVNVETIVPQFFVDEPTEEIEEYDSLPRWFHRFYDSYSSYHRSHAEAANRQRYFEEAEKRRRRFEYLQMAFTALQFVVGMAIGFYAMKKITAQSTAVEKTSDTVPESYDPSKVKTSRIVKIRPRGVDPRVTHKAAIEAQSVEIDEFLNSDSFPVDHKVLQVNNIVQEIPEPTDCVRGALLRPFVRQGCDNINALEMAGGRLVNQLYRVDVVPFDGKAVGGLFTCVGGPYFIGPLHIALRIPHAAEIRMCASTPFRFQPNWMTIVKQLPAQEAAIVHLSRQAGVPEGKHIIDKFCPIADLNKIGTKVMCVGRLFNNRSTAAFFGSSNATLMSASAVKDVNDSCAYRVASAISYPLMQTYSGLCGGMVLSMEGAISGVVCAMHIAGDARTSGGIGALIYRELFDDLPIKPPPRSGILVEDVSSLDAAFSGLPFEWGKVDKSLIQVQSKKTSLRPSKLYGALIMSPVEPAVLVNTNGVNPLTKGQLKWIGPSIAPERDLIDRASRLLHVHVRSVLSRHGIRSPRVITRMEAANGVPGEVEPLNLDSSPGFPFNKLLPGSKKAWVLLDSNNKVLQFHPVLEERMDAMEDDITRGITPVAIFKDSLKDEKRSHEKCDLAKTRVFAAAPMDYVIVFRRYFADITFLLTKVCTHIPICVGVDVHGNDWKLLLNEFERIPGNNWMNLDVASFDGHAMSAIFLRGAIRGFLVPFLPDCKRKMMALGRAGAYAKHVVNALVYMLSRGVPSGLPATSLIDSVILTIMFILSWVKVGYAMEHFFENVVIRTYGDDALIKVHPDFPRFNQQTIREYFAELDMEVTAADKQSELPLYVGREEIIFLQRQFVERDGLVFAPLPLEKIYDIPNWVKGAPQLEDENLVSAYNSVCIELSHHPQKLYDIQTAKLQMSYASVGILVDPPSYSDLIRRYTHPLDASQLIRVD